MTPQWSTSAHSGWSSFGDGRAAFHVVITGGIWLRTSRIGQRGLLVSVYAALGVMPAPAMKTWTTISRGSPEISSYIARAASAFVSSGCLRTSLPSTMAFFTVAGLIALGGWAGVPAGLIEGISRERLGRSPRAARTTSRFASSRATRRRLTEAWVAPALRCQPSRSWPLSGLTTRSGRRRIDRHASRVDYPGPPKATQQGSRCS